MNFNDAGTKTLALKVKSSKKAVEQVDKHLKNAVKGLHKVMKTEWDRVNRMLLGGFHMGQIYLIAGASGHGKSYFLNMLQRAFTSKGLNDPYFKFIIIHFGFEMSAEMELMRRASTLANVPFRKMIASDDPLTEDEYKRVMSFYNKLKDEPIYYIEDPGTRYQMEATIREFAQRFPDHELIVTLDHSLLVLGESGENELTTLTGLSKMCIRLKKELKCLFIILGQLNDKIEGERRRDPTNPALHFPTKTDIHGSKQLYHASDVVLVIHQPALLNLEYYGKQNIPTHNLVALHQLKQRNGNQGFILFDNELSQGRLVERRKTKSEARKRIENALNGVDKLPYPK